MLRLLSFRTANTSISMAGTAYTFEPTIKVNSYWLLFPTSLYFMITVFFMATIVQTRDLPSWKSSALALLWCKETGDNKLPTPDQMKLRGTRAKVQLVDEDRSWKLIEA